MLSAKGTWSCVYADEGISGDTDERPEFQRMLLDAKARLFDVVIVDAVDRFSRDRYDSAFYKSKIVSSLPMRD